jgi:hypothetical protein
MPTRRQCLLARTADQSRNNKGGPSLNADFITRGNNGLVLWIGIIKKHAIICVYETDGFEIDYR